LGFSLDSSIKRTVLRRFLTSVRIPMEQFELVVETLGFKDIEFLKLENFISEVRKRLIEEIQRYLKEKLKEYEMYEKRERTL